MKKNMKFKKAAMLFMSVMLVGGMLTGCGNGDKDAKGADNESTAATSTPAAGKDATSTPEPEKTLSGTVKMSGSTSMEKLANALAEDFMDKNRATTVTAEFVGSSAGVEAVLNGTVDIGNASRGLKESEISSGAVENVVAIDGIAVIVNNSSQTVNLTKEELIDIYIGNITNWKDITGEEAPIVVVGREAGSGTRGAFEEILKIEDQCNYANELDNTGAVMAKVASTNGSIGYVSLDVVDDSVRALDIEGVVASEENIKAGSYILSRPFVMATKGSISEQSELVQEFFAYLQSDEGKEVVKKAGLILPD